MGIRDRLRRMVRSPPKAPSEHRWLLDLTGHRDGQIYQPEFGKPHRMSIEAAPLSRLHAVVPSVDPRWAHTGVYSYPPRAERSVWLQVTAGLSNPWHGTLPPSLPANPATARSGAGIELCMRTQARSAWAADTLSALMARQQCIASGALSGRRLAVGDILPLASLTLPRGPEAPAGLSALLAARPIEMPARFQLPYGQVDWILLIGLTPAQEARAVVDQDGVIQETDGVT
ncbi:MAG: hypothetical protein ACI8RZ_003487 [Myxococcota bacterium]|jgi:hypothetical protein